MIYAEIKEIKFNICNKENTTKLSFLIIKLINILFLINNLLIKIIALKMKNVLII
jgi:hypothetical protein